jgi:Zn-dependent M16 (insulinase) family peptidase
VSSHLFIHNILKTGDFDSLSTKLKRLFENTIQRAKFEAAIHCERSFMPKAKLFVKSFIDHLNSRTSTPSKLYQPQLFQTPKTMLNIDSSTYFCAMSFKVAPYNDPMSVATSVAAVLLKNEFLHDAIREKIGAYGAFTSYSAYSGIMTLFSYRHTSPIAVIQHSKILFGRCQI